MAAVSGPAVIVTNDNNQGVWIPGSEEVVCASQPRSQSPRH